MDYGKIGRGDRRDRGSGNGGVGIDGGGALVVRALRATCSRSSWYGGRRDGHAKEMIWLIRVGSGGKPDGRGYGGEVSATMVNGAKGAVWTGLAVAKVGNTTLGSRTS